MLDGNNIFLLEDLYEKFRRDPSAVSTDWRTYFASLENGNAAISSASPVSSKETHKQRGIFSLCEAYRQDGHLAAHIDPLAFRELGRAALDISRHGLDAGDLEKTFTTDIPGMKEGTLREIIERMERTYCSSIGAEHYYLTEEEERNWIQRKMEKTANSAHLPLWVRLRLYEKVYQAEYFEKFLALKYVGKKRFSLEGGESLIAMLDAVVEEAGRLDMNHIVLGMAHRGRLNVLVNFLQKPAGVVFAEFDENFNPETLDYADVKYHLGFSSEVMTRWGKDIKLTLGFNPSHLEAVDPVVIGSIRARQELNRDVDRRKYMPILIHGDASFAGQGVVAETLNLMNLEGFTVSGTLHIVVNNQIGFTTLPNESRSTRYATDPAKGFQIPIFHVNGDDPEAVYRVVKICMDYRHKFKKDVIIDLVCYRRLGHNETDEPSFTQPVMYEKIRSHPSVSSCYKENLLQYEDVTEDDLDFIRTGSRKGLEESFKRARDENIHMKVDTMGGHWTNFSMDALDSEPQTRLLREQLRRIVQTLTEIPEKFHLHPKLKRFVEARKRMFSGEERIDWGFAEALAFGSILENGYNIRLSGQDSQRGTFSHRHVVMTDVVTGEGYVPLNHISENQGRLEAINAPLSEFAVLGFEFGYSLADPKSLVIWEAQFGDFANSAQIIIDQFIASSETKWYRMSGLVLLLPHGYEGQGPEHSSARLERFLNLCARENIQVCNCTTPAQYFHLLRRQELRENRKPLIIMTPKSLLRLPESCSFLDDLEKSIFNEVLVDEFVESPTEVQRVIFCSGKIYYDLHEYRLKNERKDCTFLRIEQLYPFPEKLIKEMMEVYSHVQDFVWAQDEPENMGAWYFVRSRLKKILPRKKEPRLVSRPESPSPAAGMHRKHEEEKKEILAQVFGS